MRSRDTPPVGMIPGGAEASPRLLPPRSSAAPGPIMSTLEKPAGRQCPGEVQCGAGRDEPCPEPQQQSPGKGPGPAVGAALLHGGKPFYYAVIVTASEGAWHPMPLSGLARTEPTFPQELKPQPMALQGNRAEHPAARRVPRSPLPGLVPGGMPGSGASRPSQAWESGPSSPI